MYSKLKRKFDIVSAVLCVLSMALCFILALICYTNGLGYFTIVKTFVVPLVMFLVGSIQSFGTSGFYKPKLAEGKYYCSFNMFNNQASNKITIKAMDIMVIVGSVLLPILYLILGLTVIEYFIHKYLAFVILISIFCLFNIIIKIICFTVIGEEEGKMLRQIKFPKLYKIKKKDKTKNVKPVVKQEKQVKPNYVKKKKNKGYIQTVEEKVLELKHYRDIGVITEEQYQNAINKTISELKNNN